MNDTAKHINLRDNISKLDVINEIIESKLNYFDLKILNKKAYILTFEIYR